MDQHTIVKYMRDAADRLEKGKEPQFPFVFAAGIARDEDAHVVDFAILSACTLDQCKDLCEMLQSTYSPLDDIVINGHKPAGAHPIIIKKAN